MEFIEGTQVSPLVSHVKIKVCWVGDEPNRNHTVIKKDVALEMGKKLGGSPIVGYYNKKEKDFEQHNRELDFSDGDFKIIETTKPYGFVPPEPKVWFQWFSDGGVKHEYLCTEGYVWTGAYPESARMVDKGNNQSMELNKENSPGYWTNDVNSGQRIFIYNETLLEKLCALGEKYEPCFEGSSITSYSISGQEFEEFKTMMFSMMDDLKEAIKGGSGMEDNKNVLQPEGVASAEGTFAATEDTQAAQATTPAETLAEGEFKKSDDENKSEGKTDKDNASENEDNKENNDEDDKKKKNSYNLDDVVEYQELNTKYTELEAQFNALQDKYSALETEKTALEGEVSGLREFKLAGERKAKEEMINSFVMLDDVAKKECVDNIDAYSLDEIEAKLSVYCFRNGINFKADEKGSEGDNSNPTLFNLDNQNDTDDAPEWVKAVRRIQNKEEF